MDVYHSALSSADTLLATAKHDIGYHTGWKLMTEKDWNVANH